MPGLLSLEKTLIEELESKSLRPYKKSKKLLREIR
jgi:hypothetical protein